MKGIFCLLTVFSFLKGNAQTDFSKYGKIYRLSSKYSMFPDSLRNSEPRIYQGKIYTAAEHYQDSTVLVFVPNYFSKQKEYKAVVYMHGWNNNLDSVLEQFKLIEQFYSAHSNAILILPEGPKNSPDSYAGKFEKKDMFKFFLLDLSQRLVEEKIIKKSQIWKLVLAGHSGAYRAVAKIVASSGLPPVNVILFDALYGEMDAFAVYLKKYQFSKLICVYTNDGGTMENCKKFMAALDAGKSRYIHKEEEDCSRADLEFNKAIFLHSNASHNEVVTSNNNFKRFLKLP